MNDETKPVEVTAGTASQILGLPFGEILRLCAEGKLRARRIGDRGWWRIEYACVIAILQKRQKPEEKA